MANEYSELEQLVNDVTSLDTARMTLRWALERLQNIEKEKADLKKNLTLAEETAKRLQVKETSLQDTYLSRAKTLEEKEDFYTKLEATMALLGEGKLDIQQLLKKEAKLDSLRHSLENEYQEKFEELDRSQRSVIERWNARLLEVESQYAGRLAESQKKYDALRAELENDHQGRLTSLQASFKAREEELSGRIALLEGSVHQSEAKVETRRRELETEYLAKKREAEENYRKLRNMLQEGLEEKLRAADSDHSAQVTSLEVSWQAERARLLEEQRVREEQFLAAQARIKELENGLAAQQEAHHNELLKLISEKETAFRAQLAGLEKEKAAKEESVRELSAMLEKRAAAWETERAAMRTDFEGRISAMESALKNREAELEKAYAARKEADLLASGSAKAGLEREFEAAVAAERKSAQAERERAAAQLEAFEGERRVHIEKINSLSEEVRASQGKLERSRAQLEAEYAARRESLERESAAMLENVRRETGGLLETERRNWENERARLENTLEAVSEQFRSAQLEIVAMNAAARRTAEENAAREAAITGELVEAKAGFDKEISERVKEAVLAQTAALVEALEGMKAEKSRVSEALDIKENEIRAMRAEVVRNREQLELKMQAEAARAAEARRGELDEAYSARQAALEEDFRERRAAMEAELEIKNARLSEENAALRVAVDNMGVSAAAAAARSAELSEKMLAAEKAFHAEKLEMQKSQMAELDNSVHEAVSVAVEVLEQRLRHTGEELARTKKETAEAMRLLEEGFAAEKARLLEDIDRRDQYIENAERKMQELENEMLKYRQEASSELMRNISEQDRHFRESAAQEKLRTEERVKQLEDLLTAKETLLADSDKFCRQKQLELDKVHADLNLRVNKFNEELFAQKQELSDKEKGLNEYRLRLEREYSQKSTELEQMKAELTRAIIDYKGRK